MAGKLPVKGLSRDAWSKSLEQLTAADTNWKDGKLFGYVYYPGDEYYELIKEAYARFSATNALNPAVFPSLQQMENDIISISSDLLHGDPSVEGCLTSGGTESIFMAVKAAKEWGKKNKKAPFEILLPETAHPAFNKAADTMDITVVPFAIDENFQADVQDARSKITEHTILVVGSAPAYPHGIIDPIEELAALAQSQNILMHVDACVGGFILPFLKMENILLPDFDFRVPGVTSVSADLHKYGYAAKGASVVLYKNAELRHGQFYVKTDWSGGVYGSPSFMGTRGGSAIAAAWTALHVIGEDGYRKMAIETYKETKKIKRAIREEIPQLKILGLPQATLLSIASDEIDVYDVADEMAELGWTINRQQLPPTLHLLLNFIHVGKGDEFIEDLKTAVKKADKFSLPKLSKNIQLRFVKSLKRFTSEEQLNSLLKKIPQPEKQESKRKAAMYGMMSELSGSETLNDMVIGYLDKTYHKTGKEEDNSKNLKT